METREEENGGENNASSTQKDHDTKDPGNNVSDEKGVDSAVHAEENGTAVVSNGLPGTTQGAQSGMVQSAELRKSASLKEEAEEGEEPKTEIQVNNHDNEASQREEGEQVCGADANTSDTTEGSQTIQSNSSGGPGTTPDMQGEASSTMPSANGGTTQSTNDSSVLKPNDESKVVPVLSDEKENTNASEFAQMTDDGSSPDEESKTENQVTDRDNAINGASQREEDEQFHDADANTADTTEVSQNIQPDSSGGPGTTPEMPKETSRTMSSDNGSTTQPTTNSSGEALKLKANEKLLKSNDETPAATGTSINTSDKRGNTDGSRSEEEMKTGSGANKDDDKKGQPKKKKAKGEGVEGEGGTTHAVKTEERVVKERSVSISLCTSAYSFNVEGLVSYLKGLMEDHPELIKEVKVHDLPYNDLDHYRFDEKDPVDVMILCHSINNRRFAITDVMDALYDEYLPYCARVIGEEKMGVIVHDFDDMRETVQSSRMSSFKYKQPKAFETTRLQITCGHIEKEEQVLKQMRKADRDKIVGFLERASKYPEEMQKEEPKWTESLKRFIPNFSDIKSYVAGFGLSGREKEGQIQEPTALRSMGSNTQTAEPVQKNQDSSKDGTPVDPQPESSVEGNTAPDPPRDASPATQQSSGAVYATAASGTQGTVNLPSQQQMARNSKKVFTSAPQSSSPTPRRISVSVCSSAYQNNVQGLLSWFANFQAEHPHMINDVRFRSLPYNDIDSFRFPPNDPVDVMVLCHSVDNRGFSITDVTNALYEKYLKYCNKLIGKKKLAVIVHDFTDCKPATVKGRMESFESMQPLTFDLVETVIICSRLEDSAKLGIRDEDLTRLICFLELARSEPKENFKQSVFGKRF